MKFVTGNGGPKDCDYINAAEGRIAHYAVNFLPQGQLSGLTRDGGYYREVDLQRWSARFSWACETECSLMNLTEELEKQYDAAAELWKTYEKRLAEFRSAVKNDVASLEASARKTTEAVQKMNKAYGEVMARMNGEEMTRAIQNAERLADAMSALASLRPHRLNVTVDRQKQT